MKYCSLFSGIGGFDLALDRLGHKCVYANDFDKYAGQIYNSRFNRQIDTKDIRLVKTDELPNFDLLVGGFPCQAFSIAGKRLGFEDTRGTLFFEIARIIKDKRPKYFLLENVKGLLSHDSGKTFQTILATINELGYESEWQILNSKNHGVPQNRERIFISGYIRGESRPKIFPIRQTDRVYSESNENKEKIHNIASTMTARQYASWNGNFIVDKKEPKVIGMMNYTTEKRVHDTPKEINEFLKKHKNKTINEIADYLKRPKTQVEHYFRTDNSRAIPTPDRENIRQSRRFKKNGDPSYTLVCQFVNGVMVEVPRVHNLQSRNPDRPSLTKICDCGSGKLYQKCHGTPAGSGHISKNDGTTYCLDTGNSQGIEIDKKIRRLTEIECERLQGFPDNWTEGVSSTQRYKCLGNAVTVNVIYDICKGYNEQH